MSLFSNLLLCITTSKVVNLDYLKNCKELACKIVWICLSLPLAFNCTINETLTQVIYAYELPVIRGFRSFLEVVITQITFHSIHFELHSLNFQPMCNASNIFHVTTFIVPAIPTLTASPDRDQAIPFPVISWPYRALWSLFYCNDPRTNNRRFAV